MNTPTPPPKRGPGQPRKYPVGMKNLRCTVLPEEAMLVDEARKLTGQTQREFTREAVVKAAQEILNGQTTDTRPGVDPKAEP